MTDMENLEQKFEDLSKHIPEYELDVYSAINSLEKASSEAVEKGKKKLELAITRLNEVDELITSAFSMFPLSAKANARLQQCLVSVRPRLNSYIDQLKSLIANPPTESKHAEIVDIFSREEYSDSYSEVEQNDDNITDQNDNQSNEFKEQTDNNNHNDNNNNENDQDNSIKTQEIQQKQNDNKKDESENQMNDK